jgi:hypothetical protein
MNYKAMLDKIAELEARIDLLERGQRKQTTFPSAPTFVPNWAHNPYTVTCKDQQGKEFH